jgi:hypothetical protein
MLGFVISICRCFCADKPRWPRTNPSHTGQATAIRSAEAGGSGR